MLQERKLTEKVPLGLCGCCKAADLKMRYISTAVHQKRVSLQNVEFLPDIMLKVRVAALETSLLDCLVPLSLVGVPQDICLV